MSPAVTNDEQAVDLSAVRAYQAARDEVERIEAQLRTAKDALGQAEATVLGLYERHGVQSTKVDGRLVYLQRTVYARTRLGEEPELLAALDAEGHGDVISHRVNPSTLSALYREHEREGDPLPAAILDHVEVSEVFGLRLKKG